MNSLMDVQDQLMSEFTRLFMLGPDGLMGEDAESFIELGEVLGMFGEGFSGDVRMGIELSRKLMENRLKTGGSTVESI